jgi:hypothetical protein
VTARVDAGGRPIPGWARRLADGLLILTAAGIPISTTGMQIGAIGLGALSVLAAVARWPVVRATPLDGALGLFYATLALSTLASGDPLGASGWARLWVVVTYFGVFWWLRDRSHAVRLIRVLVIAAVVVGAYGIVQHFTGADWYRMLLGRETEVRPRDAGSSGYAVIGFFGSYLTFAHTMLVPFACALALALRGRALGAVAATVLVVAIVFSTARGAWIAVVAASAVLLVLAGVARRPRVLAAAVVAAGLAFAVAPDLRSHALHMLDLDGANAGRVAIYRANLDIVREHPVFGLGFGRYQRAARPYYAAHPAADRRSHAHSNPLQIAAEAGLVGLTAFGLLFAAVLLRGWTAVVRACGADEWSAAAGTWTALVAFLVGGLTQYSFGDNEVALAMWFALAMLMRLREP